MDAESLDEYAARKRFGLWGGASDEALVRRLLELAGWKVDISVLTGPERSALRLFAVALGTAAGDPARYSPAELRPWVLDACITVQDSVSEAVLMSLTHKLYSHGDREPRVILMALGRKALAYAADLVAEVDVIEGRRSWWSDVDREPDHNDELARRHGGKDRDELPPLLS